MTEGVIYRYKSPSGKYYIGQTIDETQRKCVFHNLNHSYGGKKIDNARKKYGPENFEYTVLMKVTGSSYSEIRSYLDTLEVGFIKMYDSYNKGYNSTIGGDISPNKGKKMSEEQKRKISETLKGRPSPNKGNKMSEDARRKMREAAKHICEETRRRKSESHKGKPAHNKGVPMSMETRIKMSDSHKGFIPINKGKHRVYNPDGTYQYK